MANESYLYVDMSDVAKKIDWMRGVMKKQQFERLMHRTFNEVGRKSRTLIAKEVQKDYQVTQRWVKSQIQRYRLSFGYGGVQCIIPISGHKGIIGRTFKANALRRGRISAAIVKTNRSRLPKEMKNQGGNPPFMAQGMGFTRRTKARLPIVRVVGLGVAQMPLNRSRDEVTDAILDYTEKRLEHNFGRIMSGH